MRCRRPKLLPTEKTGNRYAKLLGLVDPRVGFFTTGSQIESQKP
jgi:hypothetical protein